VEEEEAEEEVEAEEKIKLKQYVSLCSKGRQCKLLPSLGDVFHPSVR
jgi:hypothetical protein